jgi:hypothetical protein
MEWFACPKASIGWEEFAYCVGGVLLGYAGSMLENRLKCMNRRKAVASEISACARAASLFAVVVAYTDMRNLVLAKIPNVRDDQIPPPPVPAPQVAPGRRPVNG